VQLAVFEANGLEGGELYQGADWITYMLTDVAAR
jgi:hypothetical protein